MARETASMKKKKEEEFKLPDIEEMNRKLAQAQKVQSPAQYEKKALLASKTPPKQFLMPENFQKLRKEAEQEFGLPAIREIAKQLKMKI